MANRRNAWDRKRKKWAQERAKKSSVTRIPTRTNTVPYLAFCEVCEKKAMLRKYARQLKRELHEPGVRAYPCDAHRELGWWHVGHMPDNVRKGYISAQEIYGKETNG